MLIREVLVYGKVDTGLFYIFLPVFCMFSYVSAIYIDQQRIFINSEYVDVDKIETVQMKEAVFGLYTISIKIENVKKT